MLSHFSCVRLFVTLWTVAPGLLCPWGFSRQEYWSGLPSPPPEDFPNPGIEPRSPTLQADSLLSEPPGKPKNTGVGSLSLLQGIFLTQGSNLPLLGLLHCRQIPCPLRHQVTAIPAGLESLQKAGIWTQTCTQRGTPREG